MIVEQKMPKKHKINLHKEKIMEREREIFKTSLMKGTKNYSLHITFYIGCYFGCLRNQKFIFYYDILFFTTQRNNLIHYLPERIILYHIQLLGIACILFLFQTQHYNYYYQHQG